SGQVSCTASSLANGASAQFTLTLMVPCSTRAGSSIPDSAMVVSTTLNPNPAPQNGASASIQVANPSPVISGLSVTPSVLWPPNHNMVNVALSYGVSDNCDANPGLQIAVTSNQSANSTGDGNTAKDWQVVNTHNVLL